MKHPIQWTSLCLLAFLLFGCAPVAPSVTVIPKATAWLSATPTHLQITAASTPAPTGRPNETVSLTAEPTSVPFTTPIPNNSGLTIEENEIRGSIGIEPLTFQPVHGSQQTVLGRHAQAKQKRFRFSTGWENDLVTDYPQTGGKQFRAVQVESGGIAEKGGKIPNITAQVLRDEEVIYTTSAGQSSPISTIRGFWLDGPHWTLEIVNTTVSTIERVVGCTRDPFAAPAGWQAV